MATVGARQLKNRLSEFLRRAAEGERITVTDRGRPVAVLGPAESTVDDEAIWRMVRAGLATWGGGKPRGARKRIRIRGGPISDTIREDRR
ncbi:MAG TPA: type II toxin-antitoxin system prevent-host-death family antitoxin [Methylomirabilota bacterium]